MDEGDVSGRASFVSLQREAGDSAVERHVATGVLLTRNLAFFPGLAPDAPVGSPSVLVVGPGHRDAERVPVAGLEIHGVGDEEIDPRGPMAGVAFLGRPTSMLPAPFVQVTPEALADALGASAHDGGAALAGLGLGAPPDLAVAEILRDVRELEPRILAVVQIVTHPDLPDTAQDLCKCCLPWCAVRA